MLASIRIKPVFIFLVLVSLNPSGFSQYKISGYLDSLTAGVTVYFSLLQYNEEVAIYHDQILNYTKTDSTGYFEFAGNLLPDLNQLYRIHANRDVHTDNLEFFEEGIKKNYHNFIFSNRDTLFFPGSGALWFNEPQNTNRADLQWRKSLMHESELRKEFRNTRGPDAIQLAESNFLTQFKEYCTDSVSDPLVKLLCYSHMKRHVSLNDDFEKDPEFYAGLLNEISSHYSGTSYHNSFLKEYTMLSVTGLRSELKAFRMATYALTISIIILLLIIWRLSVRLRIQRGLAEDGGLGLLTRQEEKVAGLVCENKSNKEIAQDLFISLSTVKTHIGNINSKLNVSNRDDLIQKLGQKKKFR